MSGLDDALNEAKYLLRDQMNLTDACLAAGSVTEEEGTGIPWFVIYLGLRTL